MKRIGWILTWSWAWAVGAAANPCPHTLRSEAFTFASAFDAYAAAAVPTPESLLGSWRLTGLANAPHPQFVWGNGYEPSGYEVRDSVPVLDFLPRETVVADRAYGPWMGWAQNPIYAVLRHWGVVDSRPLPPSAVHNPANWPVPELKQKSVTLGLRLYGMEDDLFLWEGNEPCSLSHLQLHCRRTPRALLCMGERFSPYRQQLGSDGVAIFLLWEPVP